MRKLFCLPYCHVLTAYLTNYCWILMDRHLDLEFCSFYTHLLFTIELKLILHQQFLLCRYLEYYVGQFLAAGDSPDLKIGLINGRDLHMSLNTIFTERYAYNNTPWPNTSEKMGQPCTYNLHIYHIKLMVWKAKQFIHWTGSGYKENRFHRIKGR